jgi:hypothetical protein
MINHPLQAPEIVIAVALLIVIGFVTGYGLRWSRVHPARMLLLAAAGSLPIQRGSKAWIGPIAAADLYAGDRDLPTHHLPPMVRVSSPASCRLSSAADVLITLFLPAWTRNASASSSARCAWRHTRTQRDLTLFSAFPSCWSRLFLQPQTIVFSQRRPQCATALSSWPLFWLCSLAARGCRRTPPL